MVSQGLDIRFVSPNGQLPYRQTPETTSAGQAWHQPWTPLGPKPQVSQPADSWKIEGQGGGFYLCSTPTAKGKARSRVNASQYPVFSQLSQFISDPYWQTQLRQISINNLPLNFSIRQNALCCRSGTKTFKIPLIFAGINDMTGLNSLNPNLLQIYQQSYYIPVMSPVTSMAPGILERPIITPMRDLHSSLPSNKPLVSTMLSSRIGGDNPIVSTAIPAQWLENPEPNPNARYYVIPQIQVQKEMDSVILQNYIVYIIQFLQERGNLHSPADQQRQQDRHASYSSVAMKWENLDRGTRRTMYENYLDKLANLMNLPSEYREPFKVHMRLYEYYNGLQAENVILRDDEIAEIRGIDFSQGLPALKAIKGHSSTSKAMNDLAIKHWRKYLSTFPR